MKGFRNHRRLTYLITPGTLDAANYHTDSKNFLQTIEAAVRLGFSFIQLREKKLPTRLLLELAIDAVSITKNSDTQLLINDRTDLAIVSNADGVHLTTSSIPVSAARRIAPQNFLIGVSTHTTSELIDARLSGADFAVLGPVYYSKGKGEPLGLVAFARACRAVDPFPVFALGGIDDSNFKNVSKIGACGLASISYLWKAAETAMITGTFPDYFRGGRR